MKKKNDIEGIVIINESVDKLMINIRPKDIEIDKGTGALSNKFGKFKTDQAAANIIHFFQSFGYWKAFSLTELLCYYKYFEFPMDNIFYGLLGVWEDDRENSWLPADIYLVVGADLKYRVTSEFIQKCAGK